MLSITKEPVVGLGDVHVLAFEPPGISSSLCFLGLAQAQRLVEQFSEALTSRATIDQAVGVLMVRTGASPDEAFDRLRERSQTDHVKVSELAGQIVEKRYGVGGSGRWCAMLSLPTWQQESLAG